MIEKINKNDWLVNLQTKEVLGTTEYKEFDEKMSKKIIATTNKLLNLPDISVGFIGYYVKKYNEGNQIKKVLVNYKKETEPTFDGNYNKYISYNPKIDSNNTISIKFKKDNWNREEVIKLIFAYSNYLLDMTDPFLDSFKKESMNATKFTQKWIEENL